MFLSTHTGSVSHLEAAERNADCCSSRGVEGDFSVAKLATLVLIWLRKRPLIKPSKNLDPTPSKPWHLEEEDNNKKQIAGSGPYDASAGALARKAAANLAAKKGSISCWPSSLAARNWPPHR